MYLATLMMKFDMTYILKGVRRLYPTAPSPPGGPEGFGAQAQDAPTCMATMVYQLELET